jgi:cytochrome bd-type quinol oxidase subunit 2
MLDQNDSSSAFENDRETLVFSTTQTLAILFFTVTVLLPTWWYVELNFHDMFNHPNLVLLGVVAVGGALGMVLLAGKGRRCLALFGGLLMGTGVAGMVILVNILYPNLFHIPYIRKIVLLFAMGLGAFPGLIVGLRPGMKRSSQNHISPGE